MSYRVVILPAAEKHLRKLDKQQARRILNFLREGLDRDNPRRQGKQLVGSEIWRYRVGDYRVLAEIDDGVLLVTVVGAAHRRTVYRGS